MTHTSFHMTQKLAFSLSSLEDLSDVTSMFSSGGSEFPMRHIFFPMTSPSWSCTSRSFLLRIRDFLRCLQCRCLDLAITDIALRAKFNYFYRFRRTRPAFGIFPEGWSTPSHPATKLLSCSQQAFTVAIPCFCFLHITAVLYGHSDRNKYHFSLKRTWPPFRTFRTFQAICLICYPLIETGNRSELSVPYMPFARISAPLWPNFPHL